MLLLRAIARVAELLLMIALALLGLGVALYCFDALVGLGSARPDRLLHLPSVNRHVGHFLLQMAEPGGTAGLALLCGLGAIALGLAIAVGLLAPRRQRMAILEDGNGRLAARPSTLRQMTRALAQDGSGAAAVGRPKLKLGRRGHGGRLRISAAVARSADQDEVRRAVTERLAPITEPFSLKPRINIHLGDRGERVQ